MSIIESKDNPCPAYKRINYLWIYEPINTGKKVSKETYLTTPKSIILDGVKYVSLTKAGESSDIVFSTQKMRSVLKRVRASNDEVEFIYKGVKHKIKSETTLREIYVLDGKEYQSKRSAFMENSITYYEFNRAISLVKTLGIEKLSIVHKDGTGKLHSLKIIKGVL